MSTAAELNSELENNILAAIRAGGFADVAAAAFGVPRPLFRKWLRWGSKGKGAIYEAFAQKVAQAQATARLAAEMQKLMKDAAFLDRLAKMGLDPVPTTPASFAAEIRIEYAMWRDLIRSAGVVVD